MLIGGDQMAGNVALASEDSTPMKLVWIVYSTCLRRRVAVAVGCFFLSFEKGRWRLG